MKVKDTVKLSKYRSSKIFARYLKKTSEYMNILRSEFQEESDKAGSQLSVYPCKAKKAV